MSEIKVAVSTGASGQLGAALAKEFADRGWQVVGTGRSERPAGLSQTIEYKQFDAGDAEQCEAFWRELCGKLPGATICLVNNAGGYVNGSLTKTSPEAYEQQMRSCYFSSVYMTRGLVLNYQQARIINIVSSSAVRPSKDNSANGAAKAAQMHFFQSLQDEFTPQQYQITNIYPHYMSNDERATTPKDMAAFVREQAENDRTYYVSDVTMYPL